MDVGTGIFFGTTFLGIILLYLYTRDRWKWRMIAVRTMLGVAALSGVVAISVFGYSAYEARVIAVTDFMGLKLSDTKADIKFKKGPSLHNSEALWAFRDKDGKWETLVRFRNDKVRWIAYVGDCTYCNNLNGLGVGTTYDRLLEKLGKPTFISTSNDGLKRLVSFAETNQFFQLAEGKVFGFGIYDPAIGPVEYAKEAPETLIK